MNKRHLALAVLVSGLATFSTAAPVYRIALRGKTEPVLARDKPVLRGSVVLFHRYSDGRLTSVPQEAVAGFAAAEEGVAVQRPLRRRAIVGTADTAVAIAPATPLGPGEVRMIGVTGGGTATGTPGSAMPGAASRDVAARSAIDAQVFPGDLPVPNGGTGGGTNGTMNGQTATGQPVLNPTLSGAAQTNVNAAAPTAAGQSGSAQPINPNGFPATTTTGPQAGAAQPIDPNGFPSGAQPGQNVNVNGQTQTPQDSNAQPNQNSVGQANPTNGNGQVQSNPPATNNAKPAQNNSKPNNPNGGASKQ